MVKLKPTALNGAMAVCVCGFLAAITVILSIARDIQSFQEESERELHDFHILSNDVWTTMKVMLPAHQRKPIVGKRQRRQNEQMVYGYGDYQRPDAFVEASASVCDCAAQPNDCPSGPPGPPGYKGIPGMDGYPGIPGAPGVPAHSPLGYAMPASDPYAQPKPCMVCPAGPPGPPGPDGAPGEPGLNGFLGQNGTPGMPGMPGAPGEAGDQGDTGDFGLPGMSGSPGGRGIRMVSLPGEPGQPGPPGPMGEAGAYGEDGLPGLEGPSGPAGEPGLDGPPGEDGLPGEPGMDGGPGIDAGYCPCPQRTVNQYAKQPSASNSEVMGYADIAPPPDYGASSDAAVVSPPGFGPHQMAIPAVSDEVVYGGQLVDYAPSARTIAPAVPSIDMAQYAVNRRNRQLSSASVPRAMPLPAAVSGAKSSSNPSTASVPLRKPPSLEPMSPGLTPINPQPFGNVPSSQRTSFVRQSTIRRQRGSSSGTTASTKVTTSQSFATKAPTASKGFANTTRTLVTRRPTPEPEAKKPTLSAHTASHMAQAFSAPRIRSESRTFIKDPQVPAGYKLLATSRATTRSAGLQGQNSHLSHLNRHAKVRRVARSRA